MLPYNFVFFSLVKFVFVKFQPGVSPSGHNFMHVLVTLVLDLFAVDDDILGDSYDLFAAFEYFFGLYLENSSRYKLRSVLLRQALLLMQLNECRQGVLLDLDRYKNFIFTKL